MSMSLRTATQMQLDEINPKGAFGPDYLKPVIAGRVCQVSMSPIGHVVVTDDRGADFDFWGTTWAEIVQQMTEHFDLVEHGL